MGDLATHNANIGRRTRSIATQQGHFGVIAINIRQAATEYRDAVGVANTATDTPINGDASFMSGKHQMILTTRTAVKPSCDMQVPGQICDCVSHGQRDRAIKANGIVDQRAFGQGHDRAIRKQGRISWAKDLQRLALDRARHSHLAARALRLDDQWHGNVQRGASTAHADWIGTSGRTDHKAWNIAELAWIQCQATRTARPQGNGNASFRGDLQTRTF